MPKKNKTEVMIEEASVQMVKAVKDLLEQHQPEIAQAIEESEGRKLNVAFSCRIDFSESVGTVDTHIGFSQVTKDKRHADIDPPEQLHIPGTERRKLEPNPEDDGGMTNTDEQEQEEGQEEKVVELHKPTKRSRKKSD